MEEEELQQAAMMDMMGGAGGAPPMDPGMGGGQDPMGVTEIPVPNFAVPAVLELISMLEDEMNGVPPEPEMGAAPF